MGEVDGSIACSSSLIGSSCYERSHVAYKCTYVKGIIANFFSRRRPMPYLGRPPGIDLRVLVRRRDRPRCRDDLIGLRRAPAHACTEFGLPWLTARSSRPQLRECVLQILPVTTSISNSFRIAPIRLKILVLGDPAKCKPTALPFILRTREPLSPPAVYRVHSN